MSTPARERFLRRFDLLRSHSRKSLGNKNTVTVCPLSGSKGDCHDNKLELCLFLSCLTFIAIWGVFGLHTVRTFIKLTCQKLLITICRTYMAVCTSGYITFFIGTPVGNTCIQHLIRRELFTKNSFLLVKQLMLHSRLKFWNVHGRRCEGSELISGGTTHGFSTTTMRHSVLPSWLDGLWPITPWLRCHIIPTRPTLHPVTFSYFQRWKWSLRDEDFRLWRKFKQSRRPSWTRYEKMTYRNASKIGSATGIAVKPQKGATLKVMTATNV